MEIEIKDEWFEDKGQPSKEEVKFQKIEKPIQVTKWMFEVVVYPSGKTIVGKPFPVGEARKQFAKQKKPKKQIVFSEHKVEEEVL